MSVADDEDLIDRLRSELAVAQAGLSAPAGVATAARRAARRRTAVRAVGAGLPLLATAVAAVVLVCAPARRPDASPSPVPTATPQDTAYIVARVTARVAADPDTAQRSSNYVSADIGADGALTRLGRRTSTVHAYLAPDGSAYFHDTVYDADGAPTLIAESTLGPIVDGRQSISGTTLDPVHHTVHRSRSVERTYGATSNWAMSTPGLGSHPVQLRQALAGGRIVRIGNPAFEGARSIALSIRTPGYRDVLYVDPRTFQPLGQAWVPLPDAVDRGREGVTVTVWVPATRADVAAAENRSVPAGYREAGRASHH